MATAAAAATIAQLVRRTPPYPPATQPPALLADGRCIADVAQLDVVGGGQGWGGLTARSVPVVQRLAARGAVWRSAVLTAQRSRSIRAPREPCAHLYRVRVVWRRERLVNRASQASREAAAGFI